MADPTMQPEHFITDLELVVQRVNELRQRLIQEIQEHGEEWTPEQEAKWEGAFKAVFGILSDELHPCLRSWKGGHPYSRRSELLQAGEDPDKVIDRVVSHEEPPEPVVNTNVRDW